METMQVCLEAKVSQRCSLIGVFTEVHTMSIGELDALWSGALYASIKHEAMSAYSLPHINGKNMRANSSSNERSSAVHHLAGLGRGEH